ncbi:MAG TPA: thioredoxin domain-containing protein, partial [bacterium]|nr:thioredoxin domain-containing protein [bacterium]
TIFLSLFLAYVSFFELQALCIFCFTLYVVNLILALALWALLGRGGPVEIFRKIPWGKALLYFGIVFAIGGVILHTNHKQMAKELSKAEVQEYLNQFMAQKVVAIDVSGKPFWGNADAKVVIAEFSDMECPYCKVAAFNLKPLLGDYRDKVKLVFMNYPLDKACNPSMQRDLHQQACNAAYAAHCAGVQGKFWEYHDAAFDRQPKFSDESLLAIGRKVKLDMKAFEACLGADTTKQAVAADVTLGNQIGVSGTPAVYINGRSLPNWINRQILQGAVERSLAEK